MIASEADELLEILNNNTDSLDSIESLSSSSITTSTIPDFDEWWISIFLHEYVEFGHHQQPSVFASNLDHDQQQQSCFATVDSNCVSVPSSILHHHDHHHEVYDHDAEVEVKMTSTSNKFVLTKRKREDSINSMDTTTQSSSSKTKTASPLRLLGDDYEHEAIEMLKTMASYVNQGDASALRMLLRARCTEEVELTMKYKGSEVCPYSNKSTFVQVCGHHAVVIFCETLLASIPDTRMSIQEIKCKLSVTGLMTVSCRYALLGTKALLMACDRYDSLIVSNESQQQAAVFPSVGDDILVYAIKRDNRHNKTIDNIKPIDRLVIGVMKQPMKLKLYGAIYLTIDPVTGMITKLFINHSQKKR